MVTAAEAGGLLALVIVAGICTARALRADRLRLLGASAALLVATALVSALGASTVSEWLGVALVVLLIAGAMVLFVERVYETPREYVHSVPKYVLGAALLVLLVSALLEASGDPAAALPLATTFVILLASAGGLLLVERTVERGRAFLRSGERFAIGAAVLVLIAGALVQASGLAGGAGAFAAAFFALLVCAALLVAAIGAWGWYARHHSRSGADLGQASPEAAAEERAPSPAPDEEISGEPKPGEPTR